MAETSEVQHIVERAVEQVLAHQMPQLQAALVERVLQALPPAAREPAKVAAAAEAGSLLQALASVHSGTTQKEILRALLDGGSAYCARIALFVVKGGAATGWRSEEHTSELQSRQYL